MDAFGTFTASFVDVGSTSLSTSIVPPPPDGEMDAGRFLIQTPGKDETSGILMVGVSKYASTTVSGADGNFVVYEYNDTLGGFLVESYDLTGTPLQNSDIYFAYFDYANPLGIPKPTTAWLWALGGFLLARFGRRPARRREILSETRVRPKVSCCKIFVAI